MRTYNLSWGWKDDKSPYYVRYGTVGWITGIPSLRGARMLEVLMRRRYDWVRLTERGKVA